MYGAGTACRDAAAVLGARHFQVLPEHPQERRAGIGRHVRWPTVDGERVQSHDDLLLIAADMASPHRPISAWRRRMRRASTAEPIARSRRRRVLVETPTGQAALPRGASTG